MLVTMTHALCDNLDTWHQSCVIVVGQERGSQLRTQLCVGGGDSSVVRAPDS